MDEESFSHNCEELGKRLDNLWTDQPIAYRKQNGGDYEIPALTLKPGLEKQGIDRNLKSGFRLHQMP
jgi:NAD(P)H dehydrogenase (quinone)